MAKSINPTTTQTLTGTDSGTTAVLDAAAATVRAGTSLRNPAISKANRKLANLAAAKTVKVKIFGTKGSLYREFDESNIEKFRAFVTAKMPK